MIHFARLIVGPLETNCYVIWDDSTRKAAVIDPGGDLDRILLCIDDRGLVVERVLLTHGHPDHIFHAGDIAKRFGARVAMHEADTVQQEAVLEVAKLYYDMSEYEPFKLDDLLSDGDELTLGESRITGLHTPGHSGGGVCFLTDAGVFCGDTIFARSIGRTDFPGGSYETLLQSIREKLLTLDDDTPLHPGHGASTSVGAERKLNPFLR
jgi:glyoxylase-like metal-dependent hydrolase (beta-lactamase superfamily II)